MKLVEIGDSVPCDTTSASTALRAQARFLRLHGFRRALVPPKKVPPVLRTRLESRSYAGRRSDPGGRGVVGIWVEGCRRRARSGSGISDRVLSDLGRIWADPPTGCPPTGTRRGVGGSLVRPVGQPISSGQEAGQPGRRRCGRGGRGGGRRRRHTSRASKGAGPPTRVARAAWRADPRLRYTEEKGRPVGSVGGRTA